MRVATASENVPVLAVLRQPPLRPPAADAARPGNGKGQRSSLPVARVIEGEYIPHQAPGRDPETYAARMRILGGAIWDPEPDFSPRPGRPRAAAAYLEQDASRAPLGARLDLYV